MERILSIGQKSGQLPRQGRDGRSGNPQARKQPDGGPSVIGPADPGDDFHLAVGQGVKDGRESFFQGDARSQPSAKSFFNPPHGRFGGEFQRRKLPESPVKPAGGTPGHDPRTASAEKPRVKDDPFSRAVGRRSR